MNLNSKKMRPDLLLKTRMRLYLVLIILLAGTSFYSCFDDKYDFNRISPGYTLNPKLAITIGSTVLTIDSILSHMDSSQYIHTTDSGLIYVVYDKNLQFYRGEDKFDIPAQNNLNVTLPPMAIGIFPGSGTITIAIDTFHIPVTFGTDQIIDSIDIKQLLLNTTVNNTYNHPSNLTFTFPTITRNKLPFQQTFGLLGNSSQTRSDDAAGYMLKFSSVAPGRSYIDMQVSYTMYGTAGSAVGPGTFSMSLNIDSLKYHALFGYAGYKNLLNFDDTLDLSFLNNYITNKIDWKNPQVTVSISNSYIIMPIRFTASDLVVYSKIDNKTYNVTVDPNPVDLKYPSRLGDAMKDSITYEKIKNKNLFDAIESVPEYLSFHFDAYSNPDHIISHENIIVDTSTIRIKVHFYLPIWFRSGGFGTTDTMDFDLQDIAGDALDSIQEMLLRIVAENGLPVDMKLQVYFTDSSFRILDSLYHTSNTKILLGGVLGTNDRVISPTRKVIDASFNEHQLRNIKNTKKLLIKIFLNTAEWNSTNGRYVKFYSDYKFKLSFAVKFKAKFAGYF
jgi:hypothetical protein